MYFSLFNICHSVFVWLDLPGFIRLLCDMVNFYPKYSETTTISIAELSIFQFGYQGIICKKLANCVVPDQTAPLEQSDQGLHSLL